MRIYSERRSKVKTTVDHASIYNSGGPHGWTSQCPGNANLRHMKKNLRAVMLRKLILKNSNLHPVESVGIIMISV